MPLDYLRKIATAEFPLHVEDEKEINCVAVLLAAGMVDAAITPASKSPENYGQRELAIVKRITPLGRAEIARSR